MSGIKALEKLREWSRRYDNRWLQPDGTVLEVMGDPGVRMGENYGERIRSMLDAIEAEVAERFIEIPCDASGELCRCGDEIHLTDEDERLMVCGYTVAEDGFVSLYCSKLEDGRRWFPAVMTYASEVEHADSIGRVAMDMRGSISEHVGLAPDEVLAFVERLEGLERAE